MQLAIQSEQMGVRPEWQRLIGEWIDHCERFHPAVHRVDLTLRRTSARRGGVVEVAVVANASGRMVSATTRHAMMASALHDALDALEGELLVDEAVRPRSGR